MTIIHNTNIERLMRFNPNKSFYYFIAIKRKKDHPELQIKESQVIKTWIVKDIRDFYGYYIPEMLEIVKLHQCRLYMCTDRKSYTKSMLSIRNDINKQLDCAIGTNKTEYSPKILNNLLQSNIMKDESSDKNMRKWLFDIDTKDYNVVNIIKKLCGEHFDHILETKNGYHIVAEREFDAYTGLLCLKTNGIARTFDRDKFTEEEFKIMEQNADKVELKTNALVLIAMEY
ncbi:MAG: hypothetical protein IKO49_03835 [Bacilli bacterium]|nr:hypothetical protein [Clostridia bacterium]MBR4618417.1 hypothetical protein [Bacilli bacterium]